MSFKKNILLAQVSVVCAALSLSSRRDLYQEVKSNPGSSVDTLVESTGLNEPTVRSYLATLSTANLVVNADGGYYPNNDGVDLVKAFLNGELGNEPTPES